MATIPVYLTDDDGNLIEQTSGSGDYIIVGYVNQSLFANTSGELYTTFFDVVQAATPEQKAEVLRGLRLAKGIRGDLRRFELSGSDGNAYVKYNHSIFGGRYQSQYTALGTIAGTYLRRGGSAFTKELVEAALVTGPFARFTSFPAGPALPGEYTFSVTTGGGPNTVDFSWSVTDSQGTALSIADPTLSSITVDLTEETWDVSCTVGLDSVPTVLGDSLVISNDVAARSVNMETIAPMLVSGDTHVFFLGDSITQETDSNGFRYGIVRSWQPNRWYGVSAPKSAGTSHFQSSLKMDASDGSFTKFPNGAYVSHTGEMNDGSFPYPTELAGQWTNTNGDYAPQLTSNLIGGDAMMRAVAESFENSGTNPNQAPAGDSGAGDQWQEFLPSVNGLFANAAGRKARGLVFSTPSDDSSTLNFSIEHNTYADSSPFTVAANSYGTGEVTFASSRTARASGMDKTQYKLQAPAAAGDRVTLMEHFLFNPNEKGLSFSYLGEGGWKVVHHATQTTAAAGGALGAGANDNEYPWYNDEAIEERIKHYAYHDTARTQKRDNIVVTLVLGQNDGPDDGLANYQTALPEIMTRWNDAADAVEPGLSNRLYFLCIAQPDVLANDPHGEIANWLASVAGTGSYSKMGFLNLFGRIKDYAPGDGFDYSDPATYTQDSGSADVNWYTAGDSIHTDHLGSRTMMEIAWDGILEDFTVGANPSPAVSGNAAPATGAATTYTTVAIADAVYEWMVDGVVQETTLSNSFSVTPADETAFNVSVRVTTPERGQGTSANFSVAPFEANIPPVVSSSLALQSGADTTEGESFNLVVTATDANGDTLNYALSSTEGDTASISRASGVEAVIPVIAGTAGVTATYTVTITDGNGGSVVETLDVNFLSGNALPAFSSGLASDPATPNVGEQFQLNFTAFDSDPGDTLTVTITSTAGDNSSKVVTSGVSDFIRFTAQSGSVTYTATVDDGNGGTDVSTLAVTSNEAPASSSSLLIVGSPTETGDTATLNLIGLSDDNTPVSSLTYVAQFSLDGGTSFSNVSFTPTGNVVDGGGQGVVGASHECIVAGDYIFRVAITDGGGATTNFDSATITISDPSGPVLQESQTYDTWETSGTFTNYYTGGANADINAAVGLPSGALALNYLQFSGNTSVGVQWSCGSSANAQAFRDWLNSSIDLIRFTDAGGDVLEYDLTVASATASTSFVRLSGAGFSLNGGTTGAYTFAMRTAMVNAPDLLAEYIG